MKKLFRTLFAAALCCLTFKATDACTNFIITRGASSDGSVMVSYAADSHQLYGALYKTFAGRYKPGTMLPVYDWDSGRYLGEIPQAAQTYATIGNMNEHSLIIAESTYGGREELADSTGRIDYGRSSTSPCNAPRLPAKRSGSSWIWPTPTATLRAANPSRSPTRTKPGSWS